MFSPEFEVFAKETAQRVCEPQASDTTVLGWFIDNELRWGPDWRSQDDLLVTFLNGARDSAGRAAAIALLNQRYAGSIAAFNEVWKTGETSWEALTASGEIRSPFPHKDKAKQNEEIVNASGENDGRRKQYAATARPFSLCSPNDILR